MEKNCGTEAAGSSAIGIWLANRWKNPPKTG
jgi:hypothetical protein